MVKLLLLAIILFAFNNVQLSQGLNNILVSQVSQEEKDFIVEKHNSLRILIANGKVAGQPRGVNLKRMRYDEILATAAQLIANTLIFAHVKVTDARWSVGQNLYAWSSTGPNSSPDWDRAIQAWFDEYLTYNYTTLTGNAGHYTQVVWADTTVVGCGYAYWNAGGKWAYNKLYVCNYGPAGNWVGEHPYKTGCQGCENLC